MQADILSLTRIREAIFNLNSSIMLRSLCWSFLGET